MVNAIETEGLDRLVGLAAYKIDGHGAVGQCRGKPANQRDGTAANVEKVRLVVVADIAQHGAAAAMAGIEYAAQFFVVAHEVSASSISRQGRKLDDAEDAAGRAIGGCQRPEDQVA